MKAQHTLIAMVAALTVAGNAMSQETSFSVSAGVTYTDNVARVGVNEESDLIPEAGLQLAVTREGRLNTDLVANLQYRTYRDDSFDDELVGGLNDSLSFAFVPDRFLWVVEDNFGQSFIDPRNVETPGNRQNLNYFSTGPTVVMALGSRTNLTVSGRWSDVNYEESNLDSERLLGQIQLARSMSDTSSLSLDLSTQRVEFDQSPPNSDYDLHTAALTYRNSSARTTLAVTGGMTSLHDFGSSTEGPLFDVILRRELGARSTLTLNAGTRFYDAADSFRRERGFEDIVLGNEDVIPAQDAFQQDYAFINWDLEGTRTSLRLSANWRNEDREVESDFDLEAFGVGLDLTRQIGPRTTASLSGRYSHDNYDSSSEKFDEWSAGLGLDWSLSSSVAAGLRAERFDGSGDTTAGAGTRDYEENRYTLRFLYSPGR